jgi:hypothetical protein
MLPRPHALLLSIRRSRARAEVGQPPFRQASYSASVLHCLPKTAMLSYMSIATLRATVAAWLVAVGGCANMQPSPPERSEPHEALAFYVGTWTTSDPMFRETCAWLPEARRHVVCRARVQIPGGNRESLGVYSYDPTSGDYLYHGFGSRGGVLIERGRRIANGFHFTSERGTGAEHVRTRFTIEEGADGRVNTITERSRADGPWVVEQTLQYLRTRP